MALLGLVAVFIPKDTAAAILDGACAKCRPLASQAPSTPSYDPKYVAEIFAKFGQTGETAYTAMMTYMPHAQQIALAMAGVLLTFAIIYLFSMWWAYGLAVDIRGVEQSDRRWFASLPKNVVRKLRELEGEPYIVCRDACHSRAAVMWAYLLPTSAVAKLTKLPRPKGDWGLFNQLNFAIAIATVRALGTRLWPYDGERFFADVVTNRAQQKSVANDHDQSDLELRFVQDEPQRRFSGGDLAKPKYAVFQCLFNPIKDPIWVLALSDVIKRLKEVCERPEIGQSFDVVVQTLCSASFPTFRRIERDAEAGVRIKASEDQLQPILQVTQNADGSRSYRSGYDENNIAYPLVPPAPPVRRALYAFQLALDEAAQRDAVAIDLEAGDMLLVRNQEAFYCRREVHDHWIHPFTLLPRARWLRRYMAFEPQPAQGPITSTTRALASIGRVFGKLPTGRTGNLAA